MIVGVVVEAGVSLLVNLPVIDQTVAGGVGEVPDQPVVVGLGGGHGDSVAAVETGGSTGVIVAVSTYCHCIVANIILPS